MVDVCKDEGDTLRDEESGEVHSTDVTNEDMNNTAHDAQGCEEPEVEHLDTYSIVNEEEEDDELIRYLGAMRPMEEELKEFDDKHVIQCYSMQLRNKEDDPQDAALELILVPSEDEGTPPPGPEDAQSADAQEPQP